MSDYFSLYDLYQNIDNTQYKKFLNINQPKNIFKDQDKGVFPTIILGRPGQVPPLNQKAKFKVFLPPGLLKLNLTMYCEQQAPLYTHVTYKHTADNISQENFIQEDSFPFSKFYGDDIYLQNAGGHITIYSKNLYPPVNGINPCLSTGDEGWLYINNYNAAYSIGQIQCAMTVDYNYYVDWYNNYDRIKDEYGLIGSSVNPPITEFQKGINYCKENPQKCGIIDLDLDTLTLKLKSLDIPSNGNTIRYNVTLKHVKNENNEIYWKLNLNDLIKI